MKFGCPRGKLLALLIMFSVAFHSALALSPEDYAIQITATVNETTPRVTLTWDRVTEASQIQVSKKQKNSGAWSTLATLPATATSYSDANVAIGNTYEYGITVVGAPFPRSGYIFVGVRAPLVDSRGKVLLLVEETHASYLSLELAQLQQDLVGDGWTVVRRNVSRNSKPAQVRALIQSIRNSDPSIRTLFLFGRVPVPYSGNYEADDHAEHKGAWSADTFYGDIDGHWTDSTVSTTSAARTANHNVPNDGKYDQNTIPSDVDLELGRVDLFNMPAFAPKGEKELLAQYLRKNHAFRHGKIAAGRRAILFDGFGESGGESFVAGGFRNFSSLIGPNNITVVGPYEYFPTAANQSYLWSYVGSGGSRTYDGAHYVGETSDFANYDVRTVFTLMFGSYFGDWDSSNNFLRAPLGSTSFALASAWAGRPHWFLHHMAMGETIGYSTRLSQNNQGLYQPARYARQVHVALMGDPTLRMHVVPPPASLNVTKNGSNITLSWGASPDANVIGYHVYRSPSAHGPFTRLTGNSPITARTYTETVSGSHVYMVRAIKLERTPSGSYYNASQGTFANGTSSQAGISLPETIAGQSFVLNGSETILEVGRDHTLRVYRTDGTGAVATSDYVYSHTSSTTATITFGGATVTLDFSSGGAGTYAASNLPGSGGANGTFSILESEADLNSDGHADLLFQGNNRVLYFWEMNGDTFIHQGAIRNKSPIGPGWRAVGSADFNADGTSDVLFQHTSGRHAVWFLKDGPSFQGVRQFTGITLEPSWRSAALSDFNNDGAADILFQHNNGMLAVGFMDKNGTAVVRTARFTSGPPAGWRVFAAGDFNGDRHPDILVQHPQTKRLAVWYYDNNLRSIGAKLLRNGQPTHPTISAVGIADLNHDGKSDVLLQSNTGVLKVWFMDNHKYLGAATLRNGTPMTASGARLFGPN